MRRLFIVVGIIVAVTIVGALVFVATFNVNRYRGVIQSELEQQLVRKVTLGDMHLNLFSLRFSVQNLTIADDSAFGTDKVFVQTQQFDVSVRLLPLLKGSVKIDSLELQHPSVELIKNQQGMWNFASLGGSSASRNSGGQQTSIAGSSESDQPNAPQPWSAQPTSGGGQQFSLAKLAITDGELAITDLQSKSPRAVYDHIDLNVLNFAFGVPFFINVEAHLPGPGTQQVRLQGQAGPITQGQPAATPFQGTLWMQQVGVVDLQKLLASPALVNIDGVLSGQAKIGSESGRLTASGQMNLENLKVRGRDLGYPISADYDITDDLSADFITIRDTTIKLGTTPILVSGTVNSEPNPVQLDLHIKADNVSIPEVGKLAAASGMAVVPGATIVGDMSADIQARGVADKPELSGTIAGYNVQISGKDVIHPVNINSVNLAFTPTEINSNSFNATSGGTTAAVQFSVQRYQSSSPLVSATLRAFNAGFPEILSLAKAYGVAGLDKLTGTGTLNIDLHAAGSLQTLTSAEIVKALGGTLNLKLNNVRYAGSDIGYQLASIGGFLRPNEKDQGFTNISQVTGKVDVKDGFAQISDLVAMLDVGNVAVAGGANLINQALNLRVTAVLSKDFSQRAGGTAIGGYMSTALANNQGELVIPAIVSGTFENPKFTPDLQRVAQMKLKGLLPSLKDPSTGVAGLLGGLLGQKGRNQTQPQQSQQQPNPVQQLFDILGNKDKQEQQVPPK